MSFSKEKYSNFQIYLFIENKENPLLDFDKKKQFLDKMLVIIKERNLSFIFIFSFGFYQFQARYLDSVNYRINSPFLWYLEKGGVLFFR